jgi:hypothetical protein
MHHTLARVHLEVYALVAFTVTLDSKLFEQLGDFFWTDELHLAGSRRRTVAIDGQGWCISMPILYRRLAAVNTRDRRSTGPVGCLWTNGSAASPYHT